jgi:hypothetical protein
MQDNSQRAAAAILRNVRQPGEIRMKKNIGAFDQLLRITAGMTLVFLAMIQVIGVWGYIGVIPLLTGIWGHCPVYRLLGVRTRRSHSRS